MLRKLIALAVAGLVSGGAFAQSNVTIYGVLDANVNWQQSGEGTKMTVGTGGFNASRFGFKGTEDLGGGMKANWVLEAGLQMDTQVMGNTSVGSGANIASNTGGTSANGVLAAGNPAIASGGQFFSRQGYVGLQGNFGEVRLGRQYADTYLVVAGIVDCCAGGGAGDGVMTAATGFPTRFNNGVQYRTPNWGGFSGSLQYTSGSENNVGGTTANSGTVNDKAGRGWDLVGRYDNGPMSAALTTWSINNTTYTAGVAASTLAGAGLETDLAKRTGWIAAISYDFKVVKLHAGVISAKIRGGGYEGAANTGAWNSTSAYSLGASAPLGNGRLYFNYANLNDKSARDRDGSQWGVNYGYDLSKRTMAYVGYGKTTNNNNAFYGNGDGGGMVNQPTVAGYDPSIFMLGMKHTF